MSFLGEIKRRKVFQVAAVYAVVAWLLIQIVATVAPLVNLPEWTATLVVVLLAIGFPITLIMSWAFNLTSEGIVREGASDTSASSTGFKVEYALFAAVVLALSWLVYRVEFDGTGSAEKSLSGLLPNSIAILPCENLSPDPDNAYFAAGIHESTLNQLAKIRDLIVIARTSVLQYEDNPPPIPKIAEALNVETVMECSVRYADGRVLITAQLIDGRTGGHLWSDEYNRALEDVFAVQADVAGHIANQLEARLLPEEQARIARQPTKSAEAYQLYLYAKSLPNFENDAVQLTLYIDSLERALAIDPEFTEAYVELAWGYYWRREQDLALDFAHKAIELDPTYGRAYAFLGYIDNLYYKRQEEARTAFQRALELDPNDAELLMSHGRRLAYQSREFDEAIRLIERAVTIAPTEAAYRGWLGEVFTLAGEYSNAETSLQESIRLRPTNPASYWMLANVAYLSGDKATAIKQLDQAVQLASPAYTGRLGYIAYLYALLGEPDQAATLVARLKKNIDDPERVNWRYLRWALLSTRDKEAALREWTLLVDGYLEQDQRVTPGTISRFRDNWLNDPMLEEPEFLELRRRLGFEG